MQSLHGSVLSEHSARQQLLVCNVVALHWYTIQRIRLGDTLARGLVSSLDQVDFGRIRYIMDDAGRLAGALDEGGPGPSKKARTCRPHIHHQPSLLMTEWCAV